MEIAIAIAVVFFALICVGIVADKGKKTKLAKENIPVKLGLIEVPDQLHCLQNKLDETLKKDYIEKVKKRFMEDHPKITEDEVEWRIFELKRYFLLNSLLKKTPMFSEEIDEIWHEMILFTQDYHNFSTQFFGHMLHHTPNLKKGSDPDQRAMFDWIFSNLYQITEYSWNVWGDFFRHPLNHNTLTDFKNETTDFLKEKYFKTTVDNEEVIDFLIKKLKSQIQESEEIFQVNEKGSFTKTSTFGNLAPLSLVMVFFSYFYFDEYWEMAKIYTFAKASYSSSGCTTAVFCGAGTFGDNDGSGGGDSGCSSCSSCGGGS